MAQNDLVAPAAPRPGISGVIPIYVINLKRSLDRRVWMRAELARAGVEAEFLAAADGQRSLALFARAQGSLSKEEAALVMSHRRAWRRLLSGGAGSAVVLEDDVHLGVGFSDFLQLDFSQYAFDAIKLEKWSSPVWISRKKLPVLGRSLHKLGYEHFGAAAYIVSRAGAAKLLRATQPIVEPVDVTLFGKRAMFNRELDVLQLAPALVIQDALHPDSAARRHFGSTLHEERAQLKALVKARKPRGLGRLKREVARLSDQFSRWIRLSPTMRRSTIDWR